MFYRAELKDHIRVPPNLFDISVEEAVVQRVRKKYEGYISKEVGIVIDVANINDIGEGIIIPGDGAPYYDVTFDLLTYKPEMHEVVLGKIKDIADFGAFMNLGPIDGMIHVSQTMDDFVSYSKEKVLSGKESKKTLKVGDNCRARIIAVSFKDLQNPKIGLTMRQGNLGKLDWLEEEEKPKAEPKEKKKEKKGKK
jgi:DNA-directed RNA polymerase subunit E'